MKFLIGYLLAIVFVICLFTIWNAFNGNNPTGKAIEGKVKAYSVFMEQMNKLSD